MQCLIKIGNRCFLTNHPEGKTTILGYEYPLTNAYGVLKNDGYCQTDAHYWERKAKKPIPKGTEVQASAYWFNFYGSYLKVEYEGKWYDIKTQDIEWKEKN